jgi:hypothetical protein
MVRSRLASNTAVMRLICPSLAPVPLSACIDFGHLIAAFSANHQSWHEQTPSLYLAVPQKVPLWG